MWDYVRTGFGNPLDKNKGPEPSDPKNPKVRPIGKPNMVHGALTGIVRKQDDKRLEQWASPFQMAKAD